MIAALKAVHIAAMLCWCAGLIALPLLMIGYGGAGRQLRYSEFRLLTHYGYVGFASPAAVIAVAAGTALIFAAGVHDLWFAAKLVFVCVMAIIHVLIGQLIEKSGERRNRLALPAHDDRTHRSDRRVLIMALGAGLISMAAVLWLVLAKPDLDWLRDLLPAEALQPRIQSP